MSVTINPLYKDLQPATEAKATAANLDKWLYELQKRVDELVADNVTKDKKIQELEEKVANLTKTAKPNWSNLFNKNTPEEVVFLAKVAKESNDKIKKENNIIISGLTESTSQDKNEAEQFDKGHITSILEKIGSDISKVHKVTRLKKTNTNKPATTLVEFKTKEDQQLVISNSKILKNEKY